MGYRSEIVIAIKPEVYAAAPQEVKDAFKSIWDEPECEDQYRIVFFHDCIKWYDGFDEEGSVTKIENWIKSLDEEEYGLVELGEDDSDVRYIGAPNVFDIGYVRKVTF